MKSLQILAAIALGLAVQFLASSCATRIDVESNGRWTKDAGGSLSYGEGNASFNVSRAGCFTFTLEDSARYLRARVRHGSRPDRWQETTEPAQPVEVCTK